MFDSLISTQHEWIRTIARIISYTVLFAHGAQKVLGSFGGSGLRNTISDLKTQVNIRLSGAR
jgi:putative oxidoreductase